MDSASILKGLAAYEAHLLSVAKTFNRAAARRGVPIRMDVSNAIAAARNVGITRVARFISRSDDTGVVHDAQLETVVECLFWLIADQRRCGHVVGAMQSGKTTTSLALQWAGPILYALKGVRAYPFYLLGSQTSHEDQTKIELARFLDFYGDVEFVRAPGEPAPGGFSDAVFERSPSLATYRDHVLQGMRDDFYVPELADNIHRRVGGGGVRKVAEWCRQAVGKGFRPLMMIDEPQFGASDQIVVDVDAGGRKRRSCVLASIFALIEQKLGGGRDEHWFVGLSATPFELNDLERIWEVRQALTPNYSGFNFFNGAPISPGVDVRPPVTMGLSQWSREHGPAFMRHVSMAAYTGSTKSFGTHAGRIGYDGDQEDYRADVEKALATLILDFARRAPRAGGPGGLCLRVFNSNERTRDLIARLDLDPRKIEVVEYFGAEAMNLSIKRLLARRRSNGLPFVVFVTNRARMADAFPAEVDLFFDFARKASDLNALLQGLLGRACGYGKASTVVLSDANAAVVDDYAATDGGYVIQPSRHSIAVGGFRRGAPTGMIKVERGCGDRIVRDFFERIDREVVEPKAGRGVKLSTSRSTAVEPFRTGPILGIAGDLGLFDHLEDATTRSRLYPQFPGGFRVVREGQTIRHGRDGDEIGYQLSRAGHCRFTFRWSAVGEKAQGGAQGRAKGSRDLGRHMEPTVYVEKVGADGAVIDDRAKPEREGRFRAFMVTFPLHEPVHEVHAAEVAYPIEVSVYDPWVADAERLARDQAARSAGGSRARRRRA